MFMSIGVEDVFGVPGVVSLGVIGKIANWVPSVVALGINSVVSFGVPGVAALGNTGKYSIWFPGKFFFGVSCGSMFTIIT